MQRKTKLKIYIQKSKIWKLQTFASSREEKFCLAKEIENGISIQEFLFTKTMRDLVKQNEPASKLLCLSIPRLA